MNVNHYHQPLLTMNINKITLMTLISTINHCQSHVIFRIGFASFVFGLRGPIVARQWQVRRGAVAEPERTGAWPEIRGDGS